MAPLIDRSV